MDPRERDRLRLVEDSLAFRDITDDRVLQAMRSVRREKFVPADLVDVAYEDMPLPIGSEQTISQPYIVAFMTQAAEIEPSHRVLEVGTGSGYGAAVLGQVADEVWTIERFPELAETARLRLGEEGADNVHVVVGDGTLGIPEQAPFDAILVTASGPTVPHALREQLADGGRLVLPVGGHHREQRLVRVRRLGDTYRTEDLLDVRFVPLIGTQGWQDDRA